MDVVILVLLGSVCKWLEFLNAVLVGNIFQTKKCIKSLLFDYQIIEKIINCLILYQKNVFFLKGEAFL